LFDISEFAKFLYTTYIFICIVLWLYIYTFLNAHFISNSFMSRYCGMYHHHNHHHHHHHHHHAFFTKAKMSSWWVLLLLLLSVDYLDLLLVRKEVISVGPFQCSSYSRCIFRSIFFSDIFHICTWSNYSDNAIFSRVIGIMLKSFGVSIISSPRSQWIPCFVISGWIWRPLHVLFGI
jgi:hypothetical protein